MSAFIYVTIPPHTKHSSGAEIQFRVVASFIMDNDTRFTSSHKGFASGTRLELEMGDGEPGRVMRCHPDDHKRLAEAFAEPTCGYPQLSGTNSSGEFVTVPIGRKALLPHLDAVINATDKAPEQPTAELPAN